MKTSNCNNRFCKMAMTCCAAMVFTASAWAQASPDAYKDTEVSNAFNRLDALMRSTEQAVQYTVPSVDDATLAAFERLDLWAATIENEIRYTAPDENRDSAVDYLAKEKDAVQVNPSEHAFTASYMENK